MEENILNIYLVIQDGMVKEFRAACYKMEGGDNRKIDFLKERAAADFQTALHFDAPMDNKGKYMPYGSFARLEHKGRQFELFEEIFSFFGVPEHPLICVTPVQDGKVLNG